jgi:hypothetical protein
MAIRLRFIQGEWIAVCAARSVEKEGDIYLDDAHHYALAQKFARDWNGDVFRTFADDRLDIISAEESNNSNREWWDKTYGNERGRQD